MITMDTCGIFRLVTSNFLVPIKVRYGKFKIRMIQSKPERPSRELCADWRWYKFGYSMKNGFFAFHSCIHCFIL